jgi:SagB-type dehydrogenase family enzyme
VTDTPQGSSHRQPEGLAPAELLALVLATEQQVNDAPQSAAGPAIPGFATLDDVVSNDVRRIAAGLPSRPLTTVLDERRSATDLHTGTDVGVIRVHELVALLARSYRVQDVHGDDNGGALRWTSRPVPSAGARHPFELLVSVAAVDGLEAGRYVFDPHRVGLPRLAQPWARYAGEVEDAAMRASRANAIAPATIVLVANADRVAERYSAPLTLLMRDAGALLQTLHLVATDLGLSSRILGSAGHTTRDDVTGNLITDCGALIVGARSFAH